MCMLRNLINGTGDEEERAMCGNSEKVPIVALLVPSAERLYFRGGRDVLFGEHDKATWSCLD